MTTIADDRISLDDAIRLAFTNGKTGDFEAINAHEIKLRLLHAKYSLSETEIDALLHRLEREGKIEPADTRGVNPRWQWIENTPQGTQSRDVVNAPKPNFGPPKRQPQTDGSSALQDAPQRTSKREKNRRIGNYDPIDRIKAINAELRTENEQLKSEKRAMENQIETTESAFEAVTVSVRPQMSIEQLFERDDFIRRVVNDFFKPGIHYGPPFPGSDKRALHKTGAEWLMTMFELRPEFIEIEKVIERASDSVLTEHIRYEYRCDLHFRSHAGPVVGSAIGVCSSEEDKYKWRKQERICPSCGQETIIKGRAEYGGGWLCFKKKGGCGAKYEDGAVEIENQSVGRVINPDLMGLQHTIAAMAQKRAFVLAIRLTTGVSAYFDEEVADDDPSTRPVTINGSASVKDSAASMSSELIKFAESLLPADHGYSKSQIGTACLNAMSIKNWSDAYDGTEDDAKSAIADALNKKFGNGGEKPSENTKTPSNSSDGNQDDEPAKWQKSRHSVVDEPTSDGIVPDWAATIEAVHEFVNGYIKFREDTTGLRPNFNAARRDLIGALGLKGKAKNNEELQALIMAQYHGDFGSAIQAYTLYEPES